MVKLDSGLYEGRGLSYQELLQGKAYAPTNPKLRYQYVMKSIYKYFSARRGVEFIEKRIIRFTPPLFFNDPFEFRPCLSTWSTGSYKSLDQELIELNCNLPVSPLQDIVSRINERVGILSLTEDSKNLLMWSHYAENHSGIVIEFKADHPFFTKEKLDSGLLNVFGKINYSERRPIVTAELLRELNYQILSPTWSGWLSILQQKHDLFFTKSKDWSYEREWRLIRQLYSYESIPKLLSLHLGLYGLTGAFPSNARTVSEEELHAVPADAISSVIIGALGRREGSGGIDGIEEVLWRIVLTTEELQHVKIKRAILAPDRYELTIIDTENQDELRRFLPNVECNAYVIGFAGRSAVEADIKNGINRPNLFTVDKYP